MLGEPAIDPTPHGPGRQQRARSRGGGAPDSDPWAGPRRHQNRPPSSSTDPVRLLSTDDRVSTDDRAGTRTGRWSLARLASAGGISDRAILRS